MILYERESPEEHVEDDGDEDEADAAEVVDADGAAARVRLHLINK